MSEYSAGRIARGGEKFDLRVDDDGNWLTRALGRELRYPDRAKLVAEVDRLLRLEKKAVSIPFTISERMSNGYVRLRHGTVTGVHSGTGKLLVFWDDGKNGQLNTYGSDLLKRLSPEDEKELARLTMESHETAAALRNFISQRHVYKGDKGLQEQVEILLKEGKK